MKRFQACSLMILCILTASLAYGETPEEKGYRITKAAADKNNGYRDYSVSGKMILRNRAGGESEREFDYKNLEVSGDGEKTILVFNWPGDIRDTALLVHSHKELEDEQWLYLSASRRVKRISSTGRGGSFVGSEFAYEDVADQEVDKFRYRWLKDEACPDGGGTCHVIERIPNYTSGYTRQIVWFDTAKLRVRQVQYYDRRDAHLKTMTVEGYELYEKRFWRPGKVYMKNLLTGKTTTLLWTNYKFNVGLTSQQFTVQALKGLR